ncbi:MAG: aspartate carbamoyltransferase [Phycisphaerae bacterium]|nr:aspartate carbamoyltransferase [Phycisphaerae bacterium]
MTTSTWTSRGHLLDLETLSSAQLRALVDDAESFLPIVQGTMPDVPMLEGSVIANLFLENSTRTRVSFSVAAHRLGARVVDLLGSSSSTSKGESLVDTASNIAAMGVDGIVVRCSASGGAALIAEHVEVPVINAGDGRHEHPTQGLLDLMTLLQHFGGELAGRSVAIVGDIASSRVARSNLWSLTAMGADVVLVGPSSLVPAEFESIVPVGPDRGAVSISHDLDAVLESVDALMMLRIQFERHDGDGIPDDYRERFGLDVDRAGRLSEGVPVLHPGPINRGLELAPEVADGPHSLILRQVTNGVAVRMAVLAGLLASDG